MSPSAPSSPRPPNQYEQRAEQGTAASLCNPREQNPNHHLHKVGVHRLHVRLTLQARRSLAKQLSASQPAFIPESLVSGASSRRTGGGGGGCKIAAQFARGWRTAHVHRDCCQTGSRVGGLGGGRGVAWHSTQVATMLLDVSARPRASLRKVGRGGDDEKSSMLGARKKSLCKISRQTSFELLLSKPPGRKGSHRCHPIHMD